MFQNLTDWQFESFNFPVPKDYETMLTAYFGNWHELVKGGSMQGTLFANMSTPYRSFVAHNSHQHEDTFVSDYPILHLVPSCRTVLYWK
jgi:hypothetical protein